MKELLVQTNSENTQIESNWKYKHIQLQKSVLVTSLTYIISPIVTKVSVLSNLCISVCELKDNYYASFNLLFKTNFYCFIGISMIFKSQCGFFITGAGYTFYPV